eukprot:gene4781-15764_t
MDSESGSGSDGGGDGVRGRDAEWVRGEVTDTLLNHRARPPRAPAAAFTAQMG